MYASAILARISEVGTLERIAEVVSKALVGKVQHVKLDAEPDTLFAKQLGPGRETEHSPRLDSPTLKIYQISTRGRLQLLQSSRVNFQRYTAFVAA